MKLIVWCFVLMTSLSNSKASDIDELLIKNSVDEFHQAKREWNEKQIMQKVCDLQISREELPTECYKIIRDLTSLDNYKNKLKNYEQVCVKAAEKSDLIEYERFENLPKVCLEKLHRRISLNRYKLGMDIELK